MLLVEMVIDSGIGVIVRVLFDDLSINCQF